MRVALLQLCIAGRTHFIPPRHVFHFMRLISHKYKFVQLPSPLPRPRQTTGGFNMAIVLVQCCVTDHWSYKTEINLFYRPF